jgi:hypothetical protein
MASAETVAEWELGIPPEAIRETKLRRLSVTMLTTVFKSCAISHAIPETTSGKLKNISMEMMMSYKLVVHLLLMRVII